MGTKNVEEVVFGNTVLRGQTVKAGAGLDRREHRFEPHTAPSKDRQPEGSPRVDNNISLLIPRQMDQLGPLIIRRELHASQVGLDHFVENALAPANDHQLARTTRLWVSPWLCA